MIRRMLLTASRNDQIRDAAMANPVTRDVVYRYVAGEDADQAVATAAELITGGVTVTIDRLGEDVTEREQAEQTRDDYIALLSALQEADLTIDSEVSVKLSALGLGVGQDGKQSALDLAADICAKAAQVGTTVTLDMEDHTTTDATLEILRELRNDFPWVGAVLQAYLFRTEGDCRDLAYEGSRVRLCKGAYKEPASVAYQRSNDVDLAFVRCMKILMAGQGRPLIATHDPRLIEITAAVALRNNRERGSYEYQMLHGVRPDEQKRLSANGESVRVYVPYGSDWYGYMVRRMAEKPANVSLFLKSLASSN